MNEFDRRAFLRAGAAAAATVVLGSCVSGRKPSSSPASSTTLSPLLPVDQVPPRPRPTVRSVGAFERFLPNPVAYSPPAFNQVSLLYDTLLQADGDDRLVPWLATNHEASPDGFTHTFQIREGVLWHDGRPLTAEDVAFTFDYYRTKVKDGRLAPTLLFPPENVAAVKVLAPLSVRMTLDKPAVTFAQNVAARVPIIPRHVWSSIESPGLVSDDAVLVGTGPFRRQTKKRGLGNADVSYTANDDYFLGRPFVRRVEAVEVSDELTALRVGQIDSAGLSARPSAARELARLRADPAFTVVSEGLEFPAALYWNLSRGGALADVRFRRACAHAIDRDELVRRLLAGNGAPGNPGYLPPGHPFRVDVETYRYDPVAARRLLDQAGYRLRGPGKTRVGPDGRALRFKLGALSDLAHVAELVKTRLEDVGVGVEVDPLDITEVFLSNKYDFEMAIVFYGGVSGDPDGMRTKYSSRLPSDALRLGAARGYVNPEFDDLADRQLVAVDEAERHRLVARMQQIVADDLPFLNLFYRTTTQAFRREIFDDQWARPGTERGPTSKLGLITGLTSGTMIRPSP